MIITEIDSFIPHKMEKLFSQILSHGFDPRPEVNDFIPELTKWALTLENYQDSGYHRNAVYKVDDINEVVIASWKKGQSTPFHYHTNQSCWIYMFKGTLEEVRLKPPLDFTLEGGLKDWSSLTAKYEDQDLWAEIEKTKMVSLAKANNWNYIDDSLGFHQMTAVTDEVLSLHIYRTLVI